MKLKKYKTGYIAGVFDLFHIGHLNVLRNAKDRCDSLRVGVLSDELVEHFKGKKPYIPDLERMEIIKNIKCVDDVVKVTFENINKMDAWNLYHFDCLFSGDDWKGHESWNIDKQKLNEVGSNIEFFNYTNGTSSTQIKKLILEETGIC
ncbi:MAG: adenylyltransferase/cytidyltransferase family protein [Paraclostridium bifermentans]|jgi:glycerol-3-phosphate cytidylyltransferase|nr:adenylyltransferase/cytidyltransferase family protein [Paraclostridium bifermentans]MDU3801896.1 adenylyltransferase/cytidyltransferase family protein [Paraclostridium bifermentans]